jgi:uncharacterized membrane protein YgdD (TMEM256/DUF423 family)
MQIRLGNMVRTGGLLCALAVVLGAFGAHRLKADLGTEDLEVYKTAVLYHFIHSLGLIFLGLAGDANGFIRSTSYKYVSYCFLGGILFFSGSLYIMTILKSMGTSATFLGPITPMGGLLFIAGWLIFAFNYNASKSKV